MGLLVPPCKLNTVLNVKASVDNITRQHIIILLRTPDFSVRCLSEIRLHQTSDRKVATPWDNPNEILHCLTMLIVRVDENHV